MKKETLRGMGDRYPKISPTVVLKFADNPDGISDLGRIFMTASKEGWIKFEDPLLVVAIIDSGSWDTNQNREIRARFPFGIGLREEKYLNILAGARSIESIKLVNQNPLNALMTSRQKRQQETAKEIIQGCLTKEIVDQAEEWGLSIEGCLCTTIDGLPGIRFSISFEGKTAVEVLLDGWSGCFLLDGESFDIAYSDHDQVRGMLSRAIDISISRLTS
jgi:hypothetical protein